MRTALNCARQENHRTGRRVALIAWYPPDNPALPPFIPNMGMYMVAAAVSAAQPDGLELRIWDERERMPAEIYAEIADFDPDIIGGSAYLWSLPKLAEIMTWLKQDDPERLLVLGGPSARPNMLALQPFATFAQFIDVLIEEEGEIPFTEIVTAYDRSLIALKEISGLSLNTRGAGWQKTRPQKRAILDQLASPYVGKLIPPGGIGLLETYRGCPLSCSFCEWGSMDAPKNILSSERISSEFEAMAQLDLNALLMVDAGLNLNQKAFAALSKAASATGFLRNRALIAEVYPTGLTEAHISFLEAVGGAHIGVGLQSFDEAVLRHVERKFDPRRLGGLLDILRSVASVTAEIIMGLPGDTPDRFIASFERARALGTGLRVYHCVVLPSALMKRAPPSDMIKFDPVSLKMESCRGWPAELIDKMADYMTQAAQQSGGARGDYFWVFPPK